MLSRVPHLLTTHTQHCFSCNLTMQLLPKLNQNSLAPQSPCREGPVHAQHGHGCKITVNQRCSWRTPGGVFAAHLKLHSTSQQPQDYACTAHISHQMNTASRQWHLCIPAFLHLNDLFKTKASNPLSVPFFFFYPLTCHGTITVLSIYLTLSCTWQM